MRPFGLVGVLAALIVCVVGTVGCPSNPADPVLDGGSDSDATVGNDGGGDTDAGGDGGVEPVQRKVDLLIVVDNSLGMADKQQVLVSSVPSLLGAFVNPLCVDANGIVAPSPPASAEDPCPGGYQRLFAPVTDMHVGVISTSIGGHGSDACDSSTIPSKDDRGHLLDRVSPESTSTVPTYQDLRFLAWDPRGNMTPPGEASLNLLSTNLQALISGVGDVGCGFEAPLESMYRFLIDPDPYDTLTVENGAAVLAGTDQELLTQRASFLRSDSLLVIVMLSDENDCSTRDGGQYFFANQIFAPSTTLPYHLPKPRSACANDPNDPCCRSCGEAPGSGCDTTADDCSSGSIAALDDHLNVRCWEQKRRFGIDFMWSVDRYVTGLTAPQVTDRHGGVVANPLFADPNGRDPSMVLLVGIVGVPWQDIARQDGLGAPDLLTGLDGDGQASGGLRSAAELTDNGIWPIALGDPQSYVDATDPLMIESQDPRTGIHPILGVGTAPPGSAAFLNPVNSHEYTIAQKDDLQYACVFALPTPRDCTDPQQTGCECLVSGNDDPICQDPVTNQFGLVQYNAKAYPSRRQLQLLQSLGPQGVAGSICPAQLTSPNALDFGYTPVFTALARRASLSLVGQ